MTTRAVLFDMDGVIVDSMKYHADAWKRVLSDFGMVLDDIDILRREGMYGRDSVEDIFIEHRRPLPDDRQFQNLLAKKHVIFESYQIGLYPGTEPILAWIRDLNIRTALVTGSLRRSVMHVIPAPVLEQFDTVVTAEDVTKGKPDPEPYLKAIGKLAVKPEESVIIENAPMGIRSARGAGILCYALETTLPREYLAEADRVFENHGSLFEHLKLSLQRV
jgi:beta-phosphoglucomutase